MINIHYSLKYCNAVYKKKLTICTLKVQPYCWTLYSNFEHSLSYTRYEYFCTYSERELLKSVLLDGHSRDMACHVYGKCNFYFLAFFLFGTPSFWSIVNLHGLRRKCQYCTEVQIEPQNYLKCLDQLDLISACRHSNELYLAIDKLNLQEKHGLPIWQRFQLTFLQLKKKN